MCVTGLRAFLSQVVRCALALLVALAQSQEPVAMPVVTSADFHALEQAYALMKSKTLGKFAAFVTPDDGQGPAIPALFSNFKKISDKRQHGWFVNADVMYCIGPSEKPPVKYGAIVDGAVRGLKVHICGKASCDHGADVAIHVGEWVYVVDGKQPSSEELAALDPRAKELHTCLRVPASTWELTPSKPPVTPAKEQGWELSPPRHPPGLPAAVAQWAQENDVTEMAEPLARQKVRSVAELAAVTEEDVSRLLAREGVEFGVAGRFRMALRDLREAAELKKLRVAAEQRDTIALAPRPGAGASQQPETDPAPGGFGGGPLQEMDRTARKILAGLGERMGPELTSEAPATMTPQGFQAAQASAYPPPAVPGLSGPRVTLPQDSSATYTSGGRVLSAAVARTAAQPVALNVLARQAPSIVEDWTDDGLSTFRNAVRGKRWNKEEHRYAADRYAHALDVMKKSGLDLSREASAEVLCRDLVATWYLDQKKDQQTAELMRESSLSTEGLPRPMMMEAMSYRKLQRGAGGE